MRTVFVLFVHLIVSVAKLVGPGGTRGLLAESLAFWPILRPFLAPALQRLPKDRLLVLVNWHVIAAWQKSMSQMAAGATGEEAIEQGI